MATLYPRITNQNRIKYHISFSAAYYKINGEDQRSDEIELYINLTINHNIKKSDIDNFDLKTQIEHQFPIIETKDCGWIYDIINSMKMEF